MSFSRSTYIFKQVFDIVDKRTRTNWTSNRKDQRSKPGKVVWVEVEVVRAPAQPPSRETTTIKICRKGMRGPQYKENHDTIQTVSRLSELGETGGSYPKGLV